MGPFSRERKYPVKIWSEKRTKSTKENANSMHSLVIRIFWVPFRREYSNLFIVSYVNISNILAQAHLYDEKRWEWAIRHLAESARLICMLQSFSQHMSSLFFFFLSDTKDDLLGEFLILLLLIGWLTTYFTWFWLANERMHKCRCHCSNLKWVKKKTFEDE